MPSSRPVRKVTAYVSSRPNKIEQLRRLIQEAQETLALLERFGPDEFEEGAIIRFDKRFHSGERVYSYAAIKAGGAWYTTGPQSPKAYTWDQLTEWMVSGGGVENVAVCGEWEMLG